MASNDIKQKIILEGEQEYNRALKDARRNLKTLRSELKAETAELGANATAQQKNEARIKSLQKQIKEQEKIVNTYKEALKQVKEKYSDNQDAIQKWEVKVNEARATLANMQNELENVGKSFMDVQTSADMATVASKSVADTLGKLGDVGGLISDGIENAFMGMMDRVRDVCAEIWTLIAETAAKADRWGDLAGFYGSTAEEIQSIDRAVSGAGANFEDFINLMNQLQFRGKNKELVEWLGISDVNYENEVEFTLLALQRMSELKKELGTGKFNDQLGEVFSGKSAGFLELISKIDNIMDKREEFAEHGYLLDNSELETMSEVNNTLASIDEKWDALKGKFAAGFGTTTLKITANVEGIMDALADYFNAETDQEREAALEKIENNILDIFKTAEKAIKDGIDLLDKLAQDLKASDNPTAKALGNVLDGIVKALEWFTEDNMSNVVKALTLLADFWVAGKAIQMIANIAELATHVKTLGLFKLIGGVSGLGGLGNVAGAGASAAGAANTISAAVSASAGTFGTAIANALTSTTGVISVGIMMMAPAIERLFKGEDPEVKKVQELSDKMTPGLDDQIHNATVNGKTALHALFGVEEPEEEVKVPGKSFWDSYIDWLNDGQEALNKIGDFFEEKKNVLEEADDFYYDDNWSIEDILNDLNQRDDWSRDGGNAGNTDGMTSTDAKDMTGAVRQMPAAVAKAVGGLTVKLDGATVGRIVAPYVSREIAHGISG